VKTLDLAVELATKQDGVLTKQQARELGLTRSALDNLVKRHRWKRPSPGILLVPDVCDDPDRTRARAGVLMYPYGAVSHRTAARFRQLEGLPPRRPDEPIVLAIPREMARRPRAGVAFAWCTSLDQISTEVDGIRTTTPLQTLLDLERTETREITVCAAESAVRKKLITPDELPPGSPWSLVDPKAKTPIETLVRLPLQYAGIGPLESQYAVDCDGIVLFLDLALPQYRIALEADGRGHERGDQFVWDRRRDVLLAEAGWRVIRFSWEDAMVPGYVVRTVLRAIAMAS
jgi:hypothetical protein